MDEIYHNFECLRDMRDQDSRSTVAQFYHGQSVFITGASGFIGKVSVVCANWKFARHSAKN